MNHAGPDPAEPRSTASRSQLPEACRTPRQLATAFLDGHLAANQREPVQRHLRGCTGCQSFYRELIELGARARRAAETTAGRSPTTLTERVLEQARRQRREILEGLDDGLPALDGARTPTRPAADLELPRPERNAAAAAALALLVVIAAVGGFLLGRWSAPVAPADLGTDAETEADDELPGDPHRLRPRVDDGTDADGILDPETPSSGRPSGPGAPSIPGPEHVLTNDR